MRPQHVTQVFGSHDEMSRDASAGRSLQTRLVVVERADERRPGCSHGIGKEQDSALHVPADLRIVPVGSGHPTLRVRLA